jgi:hypothetical protein
MGEVVACTPRSLSGDIDMLMAESNGCSPARGAAIGGLVGA